MQCIEYWELCNRFTGCTTKESTSMDSIMHSISVVCANSVIVHISVARGGGGGGGNCLTPIMLFRSFVGTFGNLSVHVCKPTSMSFVPTKYLKYRQNIERNSSFRM